MELTEDPASKRKHLLCIISKIGYHVCIYFDGLVQERRNAIANALELRLSCTNPSICIIPIYMLSFSFDVLGFRMVMVTISVLNEYI